MPILDVDTSQMGEAELRAHYHNTAPLADVRFWIQHTHDSPAVHAGLLALEASIVNLHLPRKSIYQALEKLQAAWRHEGTPEPNEERFWADHRARVKACATSYALSGDHLTAYAQAAGNWPPLGFALGSDNPEAVECPAVFDHSETEVA